MVTIRAPVADDGVGVRSVPFIPCPRGVAAEELSAPPQAADALKEVARLARPALADSLLDDYVAAVEPATDLVAFVSAPRRKLERTFGVRNLELPVSRLCSTDGFRLFFAHIVRHADAFAQAYNAALDAHRAAHAITNPVEPSPNLDRSGGRIELPFWAWGAGEERRPLHVTVEDGRSLIHHGRPAPVELPGGPAPEVLDALRRIERAGLKIRPRALAMTLFFRLFCCDLFIHGIGGARYERVNDRILAGFFGVDPPPPYAAASATLLLTPTAPVPTEKDAVELQQTVRRMKQTPERFVDAYLPDDAEARELGRRRIELLDMDALTKRERRKAYAEAQAIAGRLQERMRPHILAAEKEARRLDAARALAEDRTYPFFFHPRGRLERLYEQ